MALKIRLRQQGKRNRPSFRLVLIESRNPRDGKYIEELGWYNPFEAAADKGIVIHGDRVQHWLNLGAIISTSAEALLKKSCPQVLKAYRERLVAKAQKACEKRKGLKKAKEKAPAKAAPKASAKAPAKAPAKAKKKA